MGSSHGKFSTLIRFDSVESEEEEEILTTRRQLKLNPRLSRGVPKGNEGEIVASGWPNCLLRRVDTFECVVMTGQGTYSNVYKARDVLLNKVVAMKKIADFGLSTTLFGPELGIPLTRKIVTIWYRPPELLLKSYYYVFGVELWGVGCVLGELFTGKPIMSGINEIEQLFKIFNLCGSPSDDYWKNCKSPKASIFKPRMPYKRQIQETFHDLPAAAVGLLDTLLSIEPEYRGTAGLALQAKRPMQHFKMQKRQKSKGSRDRKYARDISVREIPSPEANAKLQSNIDRRGLLIHSKARNRLKETKEYVSGGVLNEGTNSAASLQESSRKEGSENYTQSSATPHQMDDQRAMWKKPVSYLDIYSLYRKKVYTDLDQYFSGMGRHWALSSQLPKKATLPKPRKNNVKGRTRHHKKRHWVLSQTPKKATSSKPMKNNIKGRARHCKKRHWILFQSPSKATSPKPLKNNVKGRTTYHKKRFYEGHITLFDHSEKKHMVIYEDGDQEMLNLTKERWELVEHDYASVHRHKIIPSPSDSSDMSLD
ncbi:hypothetical protein K7X08_020852 [Anisodus acutangulus]|uniref:Protein kinase domain-containing protein n=1 Tax=Anisodus acutangulus TaxID=402998 RepID=A0A9Q1MT94_9SOLA|nr:hypothetical protein K7X08_020852 [Anisodus acutangulus]